LKISAIVPVKSFSKAKKRLQLPVEKTEDLCGIMLEEVLNILSQSRLFEKIVIVSKDELAFKISKKVGALQIYDHDEQGVNQAVSLADKYLQNIPIDASVVFPQDIPLVQIEDIHFLLDFKRPSRCALVVPSRKFDGTNALFRCPLDLMPTHYDEDSYKLHLSTAYSCSPCSSLVLIRRIMLDIDIPTDLRFMQSQHEKPHLASAITGILEQNA